MYEHEFWRVKYFSRNLFSKSFQTPGIKNLSIKGCVPMPMSVVIGAEISLQLQQLLFQ
jgi:hypothetical protein